MCGNIACAVSTLEEEDDIPPIWRADELSKLRGPVAEHPGRQQQKERGPQRPLQGSLGQKVGESCVVEYDDECDERDYCIPEDESASAKGDYVSLLDNPEKFTGYTGESAHMVWDAIYKENCFSKPPSFAEDADSSQRGLLAPFKAASDLRSVLQANSNSTDLLYDDTCLEKRVFYRVISGMHASISTHLCYDHLDQKTGNWGPNLTCFMDRLADHPDRVSNIYFNYALVLRAVAKLQSYLKSYTFCSGDPSQDLETKNKVLILAENAASTPAIFDESLMFQDPAAGIDLKEDFRQRFRNVSRVMDCVGCDKCRLWGKIQTAGYGTALKILFEFEEGDKNFYLKRTELVALTNTLDRIGASISAIANFRKMLNPTSELHAHEATESYSSETSVASPSEEPDTDDDFEDWDSVMHNSSSQDDFDTMASIWEELYLIYRTTVYVLQQWIGLPKKLSKMAIVELSRVWALWLGMPAPEVVYEWAKPPTRDEL